MKKLLFIIGIILLASCSNEMVGDLEKELKCQPQEGIWTDGIIPYHFDDRMPEDEKETLLWAIDWYEENTILTFVEYPEDEFFYLPNGVYFKYTGAVQSYYYPYGMGDYITDFGVAKNITKTTALHEIGHISGLPHENQRADRDENVIVHEDNIEERWLKNFKITEIDFVTPYDPTSIMHYDWNASAIDVTEPTLEMKDGREIEPNELPTELDIEKIDELYCYELNFKE